MGKPAARVGDLHTCPLATPVPHVGGPILPPGVINVLIGGLPAATILNMCVCVGPPDMIIKGSTGVFIGGRPAARMGDNTVHGGVIMSGCLTVLIGEVSGGGGAIGGTAEASSSGGWLDKLQLGLDIIGLIPGLGEIADGANALIYLARGDYANAALSAAAMIPIGGQAATMAKLGLKAAKKASKTAVKKAGKKALKEGGEKAANKAAKKAKKIKKGKKGTKCKDKKKRKECGDPVDSISGNVIYEGEDFIIPGAIPIVWERAWYSDSDYKGMLGHGTHCNYDVALYIEGEDDEITMRLADGRITTFPYLEEDEQAAFNRIEKLTLTRIDEATYEIYNHESVQIYTFKKLTDNLFSPVSVRNLAGNEIKFIYNTNNHLNEIIDCSGRTVNLNVDAAGRVLEVNLKHKGEERLLIAYQYDFAGNLDKIIDALGKSTDIYYENHLMTKKTDRNGQSFYWKYDGKITGAKCIETWGDGGILAYTFKYRNGNTLVTDSLGNESTYYFNEKNLCIQITNPMDGNIFHEYNEFEELIKDIDEEANITAYSYNNSGNLSAVVRPDRSRIGFSYDAKDRLISTNYPGGGSIIRAFNEKDRLEAVVGIDGDVTTFEYDEKGQISEVQDGNGNLTALEYDEDMNLAKMVLPNQNVAKWQYDEWGRCTKTSNNGGYEQHFSYDALDRINKIQHADANVTKLRYNAYDEVIAINDEQRNVRFEYTPLGSLKMREENGVKVNFEYNTEEDLLAITNEHNEKYNFIRNPKGEIIKESGFDGLTRFYNRDRAGKVIKVNRPGDKFTEYEYNPNGNITRAEYNDGTWETFTYNGDGLLIEAANQNSLIELERNSAGKVVKEIQNGHEVKSKYDDFGNRTKITSSLGANIDIERNKIGLVKQVSASLNKPNDKNDVADKQKAWTAEFKYNSLGMEVERMLPGGVVNSFKYDNAGRPINQKVNAGNRELRNRTYTWNANDRLSKMVNEISSGTVTYSHDDFGNLAGAKYENGQLDYKLPDEVGNLYRTEKRKDRKYGAGGQLLEANGNTFKYDEEGNLTQKITDEGNWEYQWYGNGMLQSVEKPDGKLINFEYDALGRRTAKIAKDKAFENKNIGSIIRFVWDGNVPLHEWVYDLKERPEWAVDEFGFLQTDQQEPTKGLVTWIFDEGTFKPAAKIVGKEHYSIITDYLGTPVEMYNSQGKKTWQVEYDIYGKVRRLSVGSLNDCPFRYQGQYEDAETGLYYNRFRYYSADEGVYVSQDPIGLHSGEPNFYAYVSDCNSWVDVFGLNGAKQYNITSHSNQPSPRSPFQSHHIVQDEWAKSQGFSNYSSGKAPSILLDATPGSNQHAIITKRQNARRDARVAAGKGKWSSSRSQELKYAKQDLKAAGVPEKDIKKAMKEARKYLKSCH